VKIALVTQYDPREFLGGTELVVRAQARELHRLGHGVRVICGSDRAWAGEEVARSRMDGVEVAALPRLASEAYDIRLARPRIARAVLRETEGAELVHLHHWSTLSGDLARQLAARAKVVVTLHDLFATCPRFFRLPPPGMDVVCPPRGEFEPCVRCLEPETATRPRASVRADLELRARDFSAELEHSSAILAPSRALAQRIAPLLGLDERDLRVLPHGLCRELSRLPRTLPRFDGTRPLRVLHCGNLSREKGTLDLVQAVVDLVRSDGPVAESRRVELVLAGRVLEPGFEGELRRIAGDLPLEVHGAYDERALERLASSADLGALPSRAFESYGLVLDELFALGLPVWVSDRGALPERVGGAGRVLPAEDPPAWTAALRGALDRPAELELERARIPCRLRTAADAARELEALDRELLGRTCDGELAREGSGA
jgi:glycosyltransferase involved in cell wall biosynthesis